MRTHIKKKIVGLFVLLMLAILIIAINIWQNNKDKAIATTLMHKADVYDTGNHLNWKGKDYRRKSYVKAILALGIDSNVDMYYIQDAGSGGQTASVLLPGIQTAIN